MHGPTVVRVCLCGRYIQLKTGEWRANIRMCKPMNSSGIIVHSVVPLFSQFLLLLLLIFHPSLLVPAVAAVNQYITISNEPENTNYLQFFLSGIWESARADSHTQTNVNTRYMKQSVFRLSNATMWVCVCVYVVQCTYRVSGVYVLAYTMCHRFIHFWLDSIIVCSAQCHWSVLIIQSVSLRNKRQHNQTETNTFTSHTDRDTRMDAVMLTVQCIAMLRHRLSLAQWTPLQWAVCMYECESVCV